ncbi:MAG: hypothetical protein HQ568_07920 [Calditrichaeota bacterium]|nr:hypothetical protein [Calditrichota bacterium]
MKALLIILALLTVAGIASSMELFYEVHTDSTEIGHRHTEFKIHNVILLAGIRSHLMASLYRQAVILFR